MQIQSIPGEYYEQRDGIVLPQALQNILTTFKIPNALLFLGNPGLGKVETALEFARAANCQGEKTTPFLPCNRCKSCKKILASMHPDIIRITPVKERIKISQIRDLYGQTMGRPHEAKVRMILIQDAGAMNKEASNALLKILEEPPERTFFILTEEKRDSLIPTILSRCRQVKFTPLSRESIQKTLMDDHGIDAIMAKIAASWSDGSLKKALKFIGLPKNGDLGNDTPGNSCCTNWIKRRHWVITAIGNLMNGGHNKTSSLLLAERINQEPELLTETLAIIRTFLRDVATFKYLPENVINIDFSTLLQEITQNIPTQTALTWIRELHLVEKKIEANANARLTLEVFFFRLIHRRL